MGFKVSLKREEILELESFLRLLNFERNTYAEYVLLDLKKGSLILSHLTSYYQVEKKMRVSSIERDAQILLKLDLLQNIFNNVQMCELEVLEDFVKICCNEREFFNLPSLDLQLYPKLSKFEGEESQMLMVDSEVIQDIFRYFNNLNESTNTNVMLNLKPDVSNSYMYSFDRIGFYNFQVENLKQPSNFALSNQQLQVISRFSKFSNRIEFRLGRNLQLHFNQDLKLKLNESLSYLEEDRNIKDLLKSKEQGINLNLSEFSMLLNKLNSLSKTLEEIDLSLKEETLLMKVYSPVVGEAHIQHRLKNPQALNFTCKLDIRKLSSILRRLKGEEVFFNFIEEAGAVRLGNDRITYLLSSY